MQDPLVTIILLTWNSRQDIDECLISMLRQDYSNYHILIVDSCSADGTPEYIRVKYPELELVEMSQNMGYRKGNSYGMKLAKGKYAIVCNDDVKVENNWMSEMVKTMEEDRLIGISNAVLFNTYFTIHQYSKAISHGMQALRLFRKLGMQSFEGRILVIIGEAYSKIGDYGKMKKFIEDATPIIKQFNDLFFLGKIDFFKSHQNHVL